MGFILRPLALRACPRRKGVVTKSWEGHSGPTGAGGLT